MAKHKFAGEIEAGDEIILFPGMTAPTAVRQVLEVQTRSGESNPDLVRIVTANDAHDPKDALAWPRETVFTVTYDSQAPTAPADV